MRSFPSPSLNDQHVTMWKFMASLMNGISAKLHHACTHAPHAPLCSRKWRLQRMRVGKRKVPPCALRSQQQGDGLNDQSTRFTYHFSVIRCCDNTIQLGQNDESHQALVGAQKSVMWDEDLGTKFSCRLRYNFWWKKCVSNKSITVSITPAADEEVILYVPLSRSFHQHWSDFCIFVKIWYLDSV